MSEQDEWKAALERAQAAGFRTLPLESKLDGGWWAALTDNEPPAPVRSLPSVGWRRLTILGGVLLDSVAAANSEAQAEIEEDQHSLRGIRSLVSRSRAQ